MMNILHKSLTIAFLAVSIFISGLNVDFVSAQNKAAGTAASRRPENLLLSRHLRFGRLTSEDGLSNEQIAEKSKMQLPKIDCSKHTATGQTDRGVFACFRLPDVAFRS